MPVFTRRSRKRHQHQMQRSRRRLCFRLLLCCIGLQLGLLLYVGVFRVNTIDAVGGGEHGKGNQPWGGGNNIRGQEKSNANHHLDHASTLPIIPQALLQSGDGIPPIDDYYTRSRKNRQQHKQQPVPLVVGGSDGSGTRAFVDVLERLGVPMIVDDHGTMDMHAKQLYSGKGWPPLADRVLAMMQEGNNHSTTTTLLNLMLDEITQKVGTNLVSLRQELERRQSVA